MNGTINTLRKDWSSPYDDDGFAGFYVWEIELLNMDKDANMNTTRYVREAWLRYYRFLYRMTSERRQAVISQRLHIMSPDFDYTEIK